MNLLFWRKPAKLSEPLVPMQLVVNPLPDGKGAVFQVFLNAKQEVVFVLSRPGVVRLVDMLADVALREEA